MAARIPEGAFSLEPSRIESARFAPTSPPYVYLAAPYEREEQATLLGRELQSRGVPLVSRIAKPGEPLFGESDPDLTGATAVLLAGGQTLADDGSIVGIVPHFSDRIFAAVFAAGGFDIPGKWAGIGTMNLGNWPRDPERGQLDRLARDLRKIVGAEWAERSSSAHAVLTKAVGRDDVPNAATAVLLTALAYRPEPDGVGVALLDLLARRQFLSADDLRERVGSLPSASPQLQSVDLRPGIEALIARAATIASQVAESATIHLRHLLGAAVTTDGQPLGEAALRALNTDTRELRALLLDAVHVTRHGDSIPAWEELLAERLAGGFDSDLVELTLPIPRDRDDLGNGVWAAMFASLIADETTPMPVSIGLFGEWGSGKSTFMGLLRGELEEIRKRPGYVRDVVEIVFNAWHYADANLWASLGDEIFPALMNKLTPPPSEQESVKRRSAELRKRIDDGLVAVTQLTAKTEQAERESRRLAAEVTKAQEDKVHAWRLLGAALTASQASGQLDKVWRRLGISDEVAQGELFAAELDGIRQDRRVLRTLLGRPRTLLLGFACLVALLITLAGVVIPADWAARLRDGGVIATIAAALTFALTLARATAQTLGALRGAAAKAAEEKNQRVKAARDRLQEAQERGHAKEAELRRLNADIARDQRELAELAPGRRLYTFLAERAASADYAGHLGLVSVIRKDFTHLVRVLKAHRDTAVPGEPRIDRIVLYIDDLDRCRPQQVVEVLQAVHLLLALDLFVVVVGVDPRWLIRSLRVQYPGILDAEPGRVPIAADQELAGALPADYLQKIFNIPFALPAFRSRQMEQLVRHLDEDPASRGGPAPAPDDPGLDSATAAAPGAPPGADDALVLTAEPGSRLSALPATGPGPAGGAVAGPRPQRLTPAELQFLGRLGPFIRTPRDAKRLFNIYRMLRATRDLSPAARFLDGEYQAVAMLLAMLTLDAYILGRTLDAPPLLNGMGGGLTARAAAGFRWTRFADGLTPRPASGDSSAWRNDVIDEIPEPELVAWQRMAGAVVATRDLVQRDDLTEFLRWAPHVRRFSYTLGLRDVDEP